MGIKAETDGAGEFGEITPGWTVNEYATPTTVGDYAGGTGGVSFTAKAERDTAFIVGDNITTTIDDFDTPQSLTGVVNSLSLNGMTANISHGNALSKYDAQFDIPALDAAGPTQALELLNQVSGVDKLCLHDTGYLYTLRGHSAGFNAAGQMAQSAYVARQYWGSYWVTEGMTEVVKYRRLVKLSQTGKISASNFFTSGENFYSKNISGDEFDTQGEKNSSRIYFKTLLNGGSTTLSINMGSGLTEDYRYTKTDKFVFEINKTADLMVMRVTTDVYLNYNDLTPWYSYVSAEQTLSISGLDQTKELRVFFDWMKPIGSDDWSRTALSFRAYAAGTSTSGGTIGFSTNLTFYTTPNKYNTWSIDCGGDAGVRAIYRIDERTPTPNPPLYQRAVEYEGQPSFNDLTNVAIGDPAVAVTAKSGWEYLQDMCSAYNVEAAIVDGVVTIQNVGERELDVTNRTTPSMQIANVFSGRHVEVVYNDAESVIDVEVYNARNDDNRVLSVKAGETTKTTLQTNFYPRVLKQPTYSLSATSGIGEYKIISSDTDTSPSISEAQWRDYGGLLQVRVSDTAPNAIDVILTGPYQEIPGFTGPYKVAYTSGNEYAALSVVGSGVRAEQKTLKLRTGANPDKVLQDVAKTINNPFIGSIARAYDCGLPVSARASGPTATISFSIGLNQVEGFGVTAGSLVRYEDSIYRITDATISGVSININASRYVRVSDLNTVWAGGKVGFFDELWQGYRVGDNTVKPLWFIGDDESMVLLIDTDGNPYFAFHGDPEFTMFIDSDSQIYYVEGDVEGDVNTYLDTDFRPYYGA